MRPQIPFTADPRPDPDGGRKEMRLFHDRGGVDLDKEVRFPQRRDAEQGDRLDRVDPSSDAVRPTPSPSRSIISVIQSTT
ncbi:hypothetical protein Sxan_03530 [Streptomyces xanthophaeus]|uniref:Uncharacterized protein n=1 Tax=Streptomyces xanthophaeus TaxID=67385 RepID=A0A919GWL8_9ACTN|nr:hypothetical protein Sxan_03530 [Streptomyces xanthophaeus]